MTDLTGQVAVVTGASRGIGRATARALARAGATVAMIARSHEALRETAEEIRREKGEAIAVPGEVSDPASIEELFAAAEEHGAVTILICAAALLSKSAFDEITDEQWRRTIDVNLTGTFLACKRAFPGMKAAGGGRIITISSLSGVYATEKFPGLVSYNVSKYGVIGLTEGIAVEGKPHGISAICLSPGAVDTQMLREANPDLRAGLSAENMADMIVAFLDPAIAPASGANIPLFSNE